MCDKQTLRSLRRGQRGFSMIELMVALVMALLVSIAAGQAAVMFNASQKQGIGAGGASLAATTALSSIKEDVQNVGLGFFSETLFRCNGLQLSRAGFNLSPPAFSPLQVARAGSIDTLTMMYATDVSGGTTVLTGGPSNGANVILDTFLPVNPLIQGQMVMLQPAVPGPGNLCTVRSVTGVAAVMPAGGVGQRQQLLFNAVGPGSLNNQVVFAPVPAFPAGSMVSLLGGLRWNSYTVVNEQLTVTDLYNGTPPLVLANNVVALRVQYGVTLPGAPTPTINSWVEPPAFGLIGPANMPEVRAVRVSVMTRSAQPEKPNEVTGLCSASQAPVLLPGYPADDVVPAHRFTPPDVAGVSTNCFRYRTATVVIPLRNVAMGMNPAVPFP